MNLKYKNIICAFYCLLLFLLITIPKMMNTVPNSDVVQNYMVSYFMTFDNFIDLLNSHGHAVLWYLLIMPFAKTGIFYPYAAFFINYAAFFAALILMWSRAPVNNWIKAAVTFSVMSVSSFAIYARCYSIGILGLFIMAALYKDQLKKPVWFSIVAGLTANTSAIAAIGASGLVLPFLYNMFKNRKEMGAKSIITSLLILSAFFFILVFPHSSLSYSDSISLTPLYKQIVLEFFSSVPFTVSYFTVLLFLIIKPGRDYSLMDKQAVFFLIYTFAAMWIFMFFFYRCSIYHRYFFLIYIVIAMWMQNRFEAVNFKNIIFFSAFVLILLSNSAGELFYQGNRAVYEYGKQLKTDKMKYADSAVIFYGFPDVHLYNLAPFIIYKKGISIYSGSAEYNYEMLYPCPEIENMEEFIKNLKSPVYLFSDREIKDPFNINYEEDYPAPVDLALTDLPYNPDYDDKYFYEHPDKTPLYIYKLK